MVNRLEEVMPGGNASGRRTTSFLVSPAMVIPRVWMGFWDHVDKNTSDGTTAETRSASGEETQRNRQDTDDSFDYS